MNAAALRRAVDLASGGGRVLVATAARDGLPHLAAAGVLRLAPEGRLEVSAWFCPGTLENVAVNRMVSVTVWDPAADRGHQILGEVERVEERDILDGLAPGREPFGLPQVERTMLVRPQRALFFSHAPHSDREE